MGVRNIIDATPLDPLARLASTVTKLAAKISRIDSIVQRDCLKARGYELEYRQLPTPGLYLVNKRDGDPNFGTATMIGP